MADDSDTSGIEASDIDASDIGGGYVASARPDVAWVELDGEVVVYDPAASTSYVLNSSAGLIWRFLDGTDTVEALAVDLAETFGADIEAVRADVVSTVQRFGRQGLLIGVAAEPARPGHPADEEREPSRFLLGPESP